MFSSVQYGSEKVGEGKRRVEVFYMKSLKRVFIVTYINRIENEIIKRII